jgi:hypothetical protein
VAGSTGRKRLAPPTGGSTNRRFGVWFPLIFVGAGLATVLVGLFGAGVGPVLVGMIFVVVGGWVLVLQLRSHDRALGEGSGVRLLTANGFRDLTEDVRDARLRGVLPPVVDRLLGHGSDHAALLAGRLTPVLRITGMPPAGIRCAGITTTPFGDLVVAEGWRVTAIEETNDRVSGGNIEPRVVGWLRLPAVLPDVTIRPDNARMKVADLLGNDDHRVDWEAVDVKWHLHGPDEATMRAIVDIGVMGVLAGLPPRWILRITDGWLIGVATATHDELTAKAPTLEQVAADVQPAIVGVRRMMQQMLWDDLDGFLAAYR